jgi:hypothetical protein
VERPAEYVTEHEPESKAGDSGVQPLILNRIRQVLVTSRLTLGTQNTGLDPYDSRRAPSPGAVWSDRVR